MSQPPFSQRSDVSGHVPTPTHHLPDIEGLIKKQINLEGIESVRNDSRWKGRAICIVSKKDVNMGDIDPVDGRERYYVFVAKDGNKQFTMQAPPPAGSSDTPDLTLKHVTSRLSIVFTLAPNGVLSFSLSGFETHEGKSAPIYLWKYGDDEAYPIRRVMSSVIEDGDEISNNHTRDEKAKKDTMERIYSFTIIGGTSALSSAAAATSSALPVPAAASPNNNNKRSTSNFLPKKKMNPEFEF